MTIWPLLINRERERERVILKSISINSDYIKTMMLTTTRWHAAERYDIFIPGYGRAYWRPDPRAYAIQVEKNSNNKNNILIKIKYTNLFPDDPNPLDDTKSTTNNKSDIINYFLHIYNYGGSSGLFEYVYLNLAFLPSLVYKE